MQWMVEKNLLQLTKCGWTFSNKVRAKKYDKVLKGNIRKIDGVCLTPCFRGLQKKICKQHLLVTYAIMSFIQI